MAHLITGYAGEEHIQSKDQGSFNAAFFGDGQFVMEVGNEFGASIIDNNTIRVLDGDLLMYGRHIRIEPNTYEDMTISTGTAGKNRTDLIVMQYEKSGTDGTETAFLQVIKGTESDGTPIAPSFTDGNILEGATMNQMPLYKVKIEGVVLADVQPLFETIPTYKALAEEAKDEFVKACESHLDSLNILDSMEEIEANTLPNQLAGALAIKGLANDVGDINQNLTAKDGLNFRFATDGEGNYGYLKADDSFAPFKSTDISIPAISSKNTFYFNFNGEYANKYRNFHIDSGSGVYIWYATISNGQTNINMGKDYTCPNGTYFTQIWFQTNGNTATSENIVISE